MYYMCDTYEIYVLCFRSTYVIHKPVIHNMCRTHVLHVQKYMGNTCVADTCVLHMVYTYNAHTTYVFQMWHNWSLITTSVACLILGCRQCHSITYTRLGVHKVCQACIVVSHILYTMLDIVDCL